MEEEIEPNDGQEWSELDETALRRSLRDRLAKLPDGGGLEQRLRDCQSIVDVVRQEIARSLAGDVRLQISLGPQRTLAEATETATLINQGLAGLGLTLKHPASGVPSKLSVSPRDNPKETTFFVLDPLDASDRSPRIRLPWVDRPRIEIEALPPNQQARSRER